MASSLFSWDEFIRGESSRVRPPVPRSVYSAPRGSGAAVNVNGLPSLPSVPSATATGGCQLPLDSGFAPWARFAGLSPPPRNLDSFVHNSFIATQTNPPPSILSIPQYSYSGPPMPPRFPYLGPVNNNLLGTLTQHLDTSPDPRPRLSPIRGDDYYDDIAGDFHPPSLSRLSSPPPAPAQVPIVVAVSNSLLADARNRSVNRAPDEDLEPHFYPWPVAYESPSIAQQDDLIATYEAYRPARDRSPTPYPREAMPSRKRSATAATAAGPSSSAPAPKRRRASDGHRQQPRRGAAAGTPTEEHEHEHEQEGFDSDGDQELEIIDLSNAEKVPEALAKPKRDTSVKLSGFQCVICMDDAKDLTVTYCGHLFCSECLHSSLNIDANKKNCPVCRQKLDPRPGVAGRAPSRTAKTFFHLELKLMPANRRGKRPASS